MLETRENSLVAEKTRMKTEQSSTAAKRLARSQVARGFKGKIQQRVVRRVPLNSQTFVHLIQRQQHK